METVTNPATGEVEQLVPEPAETGDEPVVPSEPVVPEPAETGDEPVVPSEPAVVAPVKAKKPDTTPKEEKVYIKKIRDEKRKAEEERDFWKNLAATQAPKPTAQDLIPVISEETQAALDLLDEQVNSGKLNVSYDVANAMRTTIVNNANKPKAPASAPTAPVVNPMEEKVRQFQDAIDEAEEEIPGVREAIVALTQIPEVDSNPIIGSAITDGGEYGMKLAHYLGNHIDYAKKIASLSAFAATKELLKVEEYLNKTQRKVSKATPPLTPVKAATASAASKPKSFSDDVNAELAAIAAKRRR